MRKLVSLLLTGILAGALVVVSAGPAIAYCHVVSFSKSDYPVKESDGAVEITINRMVPDNTPGCTGTLEYNTIDGNAKAPSDYKAIPPGTKHDINDQFEKSFKFTVQIENDTIFEGEEKFSVRFKHTPSVTGSGFSAVEGTATVTIQDNDPSPTQPTSPKTSPTASPTPTVSPTLEATAGSPLPLEASPTESPEAEAEAASEDDGTPIGLIVGAIALLLAVAAGLGLWLVRRRAA